MRLKAWRIVRREHVSSAWTGEGARLFGGRWNSLGTPMVYAAGSLALAMLEMLVHLQATEMLERYVGFEAEFDPSLVTVLDRPPAGWRRSPVSRAVQRVGDAWVAAGGSPVLRVPSVVVPTEWNYLIHPGHPDFSRVKIGPGRAVRFDPRLAKADAT